MKTFLASLTVLLLGMPAQAQPWVAEQVIHSLDADEARQGVASDGRYAYAIDNSRIGKYDLKTGKRVAAWQGDAALFPHMNACTMADRQLFCSASNFPKVPMTSAIEIFDPVAMKHLSTISLGMQIGSLTWLDRKDGFWWAGFANYDGRGGEPGRDHRYTTIVKFDSQWRRLESFALPDAVLERMAPMSNSGGGWGDDGLLYITGHDKPEMYVLRLPSAGSVLELVATVEIPFGGQAIDWDPAGKRLLWGISRKDKKAIAVTVPPVTAKSDVAR